MFVVDAISQKLKVDQYFTLGAAIIRTIRPREAHEVSGDFEKLVRDFVAEHQERLGRYSKLHETISEAPLGNNSEQKLGQFLGDSIVHWLFNDDEQPLFALADQVPRLDDMIRKLEFGETFALAAVMENQRTRRNRQALIAVVVLAVLGVALWWFTSR
jgi:hypothetical protein